MSTRERREKLAQAKELSLERASLWMVYRGGRTGWRLVKAKSAEQAMKRVSRSTFARPSLTSSEWRAIYQEVGLSRG